MDRACIFSEKQIVYYECSNIVCELLAGFSSEALVTKNWVFILCRNQIYSGSLIEWLLPWFWRGGKVIKHLSEGVRLYAAFSDIPAAFISVMVWDSRNWLPSLFLPGIWGIKTGLQHDKKTVLLQRPKQKAAERRTIVKLSRL